MVLEEQADWHAVTVEKRACISWETRNNSEVLPCGGLEVDRPHFFNSIIGELWLPGNQMFWNLRTVLICDLIFSTPQQHLLPPGSAATPCLLQTP